MKLNDLVQTVEAGTILKRAKYNHNAKDVALDNEGNLRRVIGNMADMSVVELEKGGHCLSVEDLMANDWEITNLSNETTEFFIDDCED